MERANCQRHWPKRRRRPRAPGRILPVRRAASRAPMIMYSERSAATGWNFTPSVMAWPKDGNMPAAAMKIGLYSITYRGVWYRGEAVDVFSLVRLAGQQGWEGLELDAERPHAAPMDLSSDDRRRLRDLAGEVGLELCAVSPNCDLSSPVPVQRETMIGYVRECIRLAHDVGSPICKIFAAWRGITLHNGLATYDETYNYNQYG